MKRCTQPFPCLVDIMVLAGVNGACDACAPSVQRMRDLHGWKAEGALFVCDRLTPEQRSKVEAAIQEATDAGGELAAYESMYGHEDRERDMARHGDDCDCAECESSRAAWREL